MRAHMLGLYQRILNSCINYSGNIAWIRIGDAVFIEYCLAKSSALFMAWVKSPVGLGVSFFQTADGVFS